MTPPALPAMDFGNGRLCTHTGGEPRAEPGGCDHPPPSSSPAPRQHAGQSATTGAYYSHLRPPCVIRGADCSETPVFAGDSGGDEGQNWDGFAQPVGPQSARTSLPRVGESGACEHRELAQQGWGEMRRHASTGLAWTVPPNPGSLGPRWTRGPKLRLPSPRGEGFRSTQASPTQLGRKVDRRSISAPTRTAPPETGSSGDGL